MQKFHKSNQIAQRDHNQKVRSSTGAMVNAKGIQFERNVRHPLRLQDMKVSGYNIDDAHRQFG